MEMGRVSKRFIRGRVLREMLKQAAIRCFAEHDPLFQVDASIL